MTIPAATALSTHVLYACADDLGAVAEIDDENNCIESSIVTVTRPDLVENTVSAPPATKARGTSFPVTDAVQNVGAVASGASATRYYLSLDAVKSAGDALLTGSRTVPGSGGRGQPFRDRHGDDPRGHPAQYVLPARLCRCPEHGGGDRRGQQL